MKSKKKKTKPTVQPHETEFFDKAAIAAMQAMITNQEYVNSLNKASNLNKVDILTFMAGIACFYAEAMLKRRKEMLK